MHRSTRNFCGKALAAASALALLTSACGGGDSGGGGDAIKVMLLSQL